MLIICMKGMHQEYALVLKGLKKKAKENEHDKEIRNLIIK